MVLLWILFGISAAIALIISYYWIKFDAPHLVLGMGLLGILMFLVSIVWAIAAMYKGEPIAATLWMLSVGVPGILLILGGWKLMEYNNSHK